MSPIACTPCYVTYWQPTPVHLTGCRFHVRSDGTVYAYVFNPATREQTDGEQLPPADAKLVRQEASRQRRSQRQDHRLTIKNEQGFCSCGVWVRPESEHSTDTVHTRIRKGFKHHLDRIERGELDPWEAPDALMPDNQDLGVRRLPGGGWE